MALDLSNIAVYTDQISGKLIHQILLQGATTKYVTVQPTVKYSESINLLSNTMYLQAGNAGWNSSGSTVLTQRNIVVAPVKVQQNFDLYGPTSIEQYWIGQSMKPGSGAEGGTLPFEEVFTGYLAEQTSALMDVNLWLSGYLVTTADTFSADTTAYTTAQGLTAGVVGFLSILRTASATTVNVPFTAATAGNIINTVNTIIANIPTDILAEEDILIFMSPANVQLLKQAYVTANLYHYEADDNTALTQKIFGFSNIKAVGTVGLKGSYRMVCSYASNFYVGTDLVSELGTETQFKLFYSLDADTLKYNWRAKIGTQVAFPQHVVVL
jgi:hypothetical protein